MRVIPYILFLLLVGMHVVFLRDVTSIYGVSPDLPILIVLLVALYKNDTVATWFGFAVGLVAFAALPERFGWYALLMAAVAFAACQVRERLNLESLKAKLLLVAGGVLLHGILIQLIDTAGSLAALWTLVPAVTVYTTVIAWLFFLFKEGTITFEKTKSIF
ncbi:MAG: rod shape-determining protein MreD [Candidatus Zixiibacteriota bacterium]|nr:MAG: rod shape-determining protein MreD [candidate division Zixibacteria bacterium]